MKIASLGMYDRQETKTANQEFFSKISEELIKNNILAPRALVTVKDQLKLWKSKDLFLSQTCGLPYKLFLKDKVTLIGTLDYNIEGCQPGYYNSVFIVKKENIDKTLANLSRSKFAVNEYHSLSGWAAPQNYLRKLKLKFNNVIISGSHRNSAKMVSEGMADIASIDAVSFKFIKAYDNFSHNLRVIDVTPPAPGLPLITYKGANKSVFFSAVENAIHAMDSLSRQKLMIKGITSITKAEYLNIEIPKP